MHPDGEKLRVVLEKLSEIQTDAYLQIESGDHARDGYLDIQTEYVLGVPGTESATVTLVHYTEDELDAMQDPPDGRADA